MTEIDNDKLLKDFFAENKREIADNGFSRRVMHHLPDRSNRLARLWTVFVMAVGATLFVTLGGLEAVWETLKDVLIGMINHGATSLDPKSIIIATVVLLFMAGRKVVSMAYNCLTHSGPWVWQCCDTALEPQSPAFAKCVPTAGNTADSSDVSNEYNSPDQEILVHFFC